MEVNNYRSEAVALWKMLKSVGHRCHMGKLGNIVRIMFSDSSSAFITVQQLQLRKKTERTGLDQQIIRWMSSYVSNRAEYLRLPKLCI